jgi:hypothetical protein
MQTHRRERERKKKGVNTQVKCQQFMKCLAFFKIGSALAILCYYNRVTESEDSFNHFTTHIKSSLLCVYYFSF